MKLDPPQTHEEGLALGRIQREVRYLTDAQIAQWPSNILFFLGDAIARERRQAVSEALAERETELQRLKRIEAIALRIAVKDASGDDPEGFRTLAGELREAVGEDVVEAVLDAQAAGLGEAEPE